MINDKVNEKHPKGYFLAFFPQVAENKILVLKKMFYICF